MKGNSTKDFNLNSILHGTGFNRFYCKKSMNLISIKDYIDAWPCSILITIVCFVWLAEICRSLIQAWVVKLSCVTSNLLLKNTILFSCYNFDYWAKLQACVEYNPNFGLTLNWRNEGGVEHTCINYLANDYCDSVNKLKYGYKLWQNFIKNLIIFFLKSVL